MADFIPIHFGKRVVISWHRAWDSLNPSGSSQSVPWGKAGNKPQGGDNELLNILEKEDLSARCKLWYCYYDNFKIGPPILWQSSLHNVEPNFLPLECGLDLAIHF